MNLPKLILEAEYWSRAARDEYIRGAHEVAKDHLILLAGKIMGEVPGPGEKPAPWPGHGQT